VELLRQGKTPTSIARSLAASAITRLGKTCSFFGAWGSRTSGGKLYTGRNLDWEADTGVAKYKVVTVYHVEGTHAYASISFAGLAGAIAGMSAKGITVHEAGDDNTLETLKVALAATPGARSNACLCWPVMTVLPAIDCTGSAWLRKPVVAENCPCLPVLLGLLLAALGSSWQLLAALGSS